MPTPYGLRCRVSRSVSLAVLRLRWARSIRAALELTWTRLATTWAMTVSLSFESANSAAATRAVVTESETAADLAYLLGRGTSLGGMRPKCTVVDEDGRLAVGKFPSVNDERLVSKGEVLAMFRSSPISGFRRRERGRF